MSTTTATILPQPPSDVVLPEPEIITSTTTTSNMFLENASPDGTSFAFSHCEAIPEQTSIVSRENSYTNMSPAHSLTAQSFESEPTPLQPSDSVERFKCSGSSLTASSTNYCTNDTTAANGLPEDELKNVQADGSGAGDGSTQSKESVKRLTTILTNSLKIGSQNLSGSPEVTMSERATGCVDLHLLPCSTTAVVSSPADVVKLSMANEAEVIQSDAGTTTSTVPMVDSDQSESLTTLSRKSSSSALDESGGAEQTRRTQELIKKQINEIERELSRRIQNKNVKKMDEVELVQLLNDHKFGNFVGGVELSEDTARSRKAVEGVVKETGLPYRPPPLNASHHSPIGPSLNQLRSSFSPPTAVAADFTMTQPGFYYDSALNVAANFHMYNQPGMEPLHQSQMGFQQPGGVPGPFITSAVMPQQPHQQLIGEQQQFMIAVGSHQQQLPQQGFHHATPNSGGARVNHHSASGAGISYATSASAPFYAAAPPFSQQQHQNCIPQQQFYPPQKQHDSSVIKNGNVPSSLSPANISSTPFPQQHQQPVPSSITQSSASGIISAEMAAALLQQIQQQNPGLFETLVKRQGTNDNGSVAAPDSNELKSSQNGEHRRSVEHLSVLPAPPQPQNCILPRQHVAAGKATSDVAEDLLGIGKKAEFVLIFQAFQSSSFSTDSKNNNVKVETADRWHDPKLSNHHCLSEQNGCTMNKENCVEPHLRESYLKRLQRDEQRSKEEQELAGSTACKIDEIASSNNDTVVPLSSNGEEKETDRLLHSDVGTGCCGGDGGAAAASNTIEADLLCASGDSGGNRRLAKKSSNAKKEIMVHEPAVLIEGVLFRARYLGSTQLITDGRPTKSSRMSQAQEAVARVKAPKGEIQPSTEIDLFISTEKIMVLNTDLQDILMDHALRSISYIADIGDLVVLMARRVPSQAAVGGGSASALLNAQQSYDDDDECGIDRTPRVVCHVFESEEASFIAQSIGQAFQVAYVEFLRANGIDDPVYLREIDYQEVLNSQELMGEELEMFARKETQKDIVVPKKVGEPLGIVVVESGWGSILPTVVVANMAPGGPAARSNQLNIGDQNAKTSTAVRLTVVSTPPVVEVRIKRPDTKYQLGFSVQNGVICSLLRGGIAERGGIRVGHRIIEINHQSVVAVPHERIVNMLATATGEIQMKTMPTSMFRLLTGQEVPNYI